MHALLIGATGATGKDVLELLLQDEHFTQVDAFVRRSTGISNLKYHEYVIDFNKPDEWKKLVKGDVLFSALGTTLKAAGSKDDQWKIDYDYQYEFAKAAKENGVPHYVLVSSSGASSKSSIFYSRMKGELEDAVKALHFSTLSIFNPPILIRKNSDRGGELIGVKIINTLNKIGLLKSQQPLATEALAMAMVNVAKQKNKGGGVYKGEEIRKLALT